MKKKDIDIYQSADKAIKTMNRDIIRDFGTLKTAKYDELNIVQSVTQLYRRQQEKARRRYYEVAFEGYLIGMYLVEMDVKKAQEMAEKAITPEWIDRLLTEVDPVTMYRFDTETERKAQRLAEILSASPTPSREIDRAAVIWSKQTGQYAINATDEAIKQAYIDAGVEMVMWVTARDERVCDECGPRDGKIYSIDEVPPKPHWGCRCVLLPV